MDTSHYCSDFGLVQFISLKVINWTEGGKHWKSMENFQEGSAINFGVELQ